MIPAALGSICAKTGLRLVGAAGQIAYRVAKDRYGALSTRTNDYVGPVPSGSDASVGDSRGRYDTIGSTLYLADSRQCAYAEVLMGFRRDRAALAGIADSIGWRVDDYMASIQAQAEANEVDIPWAISVGWQMDRSIYEIRLPQNGWWVQIDDADTLLRLQHITPAMEGVSHQLRLLTSGSLNGEDRDLTTLLAQAIRGLTLHDGSEPLGISYPSKTMMGRCWAYWDRRTDACLTREKDGLLQLTSQNVGPDPEFRRTAKKYDLPILGAQNASAGLRSGYGRDF